MRYLFLVICFSTLSATSRSQCNLDEIVNRTWINNRQVMKSDSTVRYNSQIQFVLKEEEILWRAIVNYSEEERYMKYSISECMNEIAELKISKSKNNQGGFAYVRWFEESLILGFSDIRIPIEEIDDSEIIWLDFKLLK